MWDEIFIKVPNFLNRIIVKYLFQTYGVSISIVAMMQ